MKENTASTIITRTLGTDNDYQYKIDCIVRKWGQYVGLANENELKEMHIYALHKLFENKLKTNTVRKYRAALKWKAAQLGLKIDSKKLEINKRFTRSAKAKFYPKELRLAVARNVRNCEWKSNKYAKDFLTLHLIAGPLLGYRMKELRGLNVSIDGGVVNVQIINGKNSNGRANGDYRTLIYPRLHNGMDLAKAFLKLKKFGEMSDYFAIVKSAANLHRKCLNELDVEQIIGVKLNPVMTTIRHEFKLAFEEANGALLTSAAMGHSSMITQKRDYGDKSTGGRKKLKYEKDEELINLMRIVKVAEENVEKVVKRISDVESVLADVKAKVKLNTPSM
ncbi:hypothetical protein V6259_18065 [Marinomonas sp. TI.3.20]|uniref:hypothetical protein n=1 Tax=Marinomonas sp. TI.3.20 TaxID=3121296 RepID=UPI00311D2EBA